MAYATLTRCLTDRGPSNAYLPTSHENVKGQSRERSSYHFSIVLVLYDSEVVGDRAWILVAVTCRFADPSSVCQL